MFLPDQFEGRYKVPLGNSGVEIMYRMYSLHDPNAGPVHSGTLGLSVLEDKAAGIIVTRYGYALELVRESLKGWLDSGQYNDWQETSFASGSPLSCRTDWVLETAAVLARTKGSGKVSSRELLVAGVLLDGITSGVFQHHGLENRMGLLRANNVCR